MLLLLNVSLGVESFYIVMLFMTTRVFWYDVVLTLTNTVTSLTATTMTTNPTVKPIKILGNPYESPISDHICNFSDELYPLMGSIIDRLCWY